MGLSTIAQRLAAFQASQEGAAALPALDSAMIEAAGGDATLRAFAAPVAGWANAPAGVSAPIVGGRYVDRLPRPAGLRRLAHFPSVADMNSASAYRADVIDADGSLYGDTVCRATITNTSRYLAPAAPLATPVNVQGGGSLRLVFRTVLNLTTAIDRFAIELHSAGSPAAVTANYHTTSPTNLAAIKSVVTSPNGMGAWQTLSVALPYFTPVGTGADLGAIAFARLFLRASSGNTFSIDVDGIDFAPNSRTKAKCFISFDDAHLLAYAARQMAKYGFPGVFYPGRTAFDIGSAGRLSVENVKLMHDIRHWQVGAQALLSEQLADFQALGPVGRTQNMAKQRGIHAALGLTGGVDGSWHTTVTHKDLDVYEAIRQHYRTMRMNLVAAGGGVPLFFGETLPIGDPMRLRAMALSGTAERNQAHVDDGIANKGLVGFTVHNDTAAAGAGRIAFDTLLAYLDSQRAAIDVLTLDQILAGL